MAKTKPLILNEMAHVYFLRKMRTGWTSACTLAESAPQSNVAVGKCKYISIC